MKEEVYSYIVSSIHLLNQSLKNQNIHTTQLFSYMYNNYCDMSEQIQNSATNQDIKFLSYCILNLDNKTKKILNKTKTIDENIVQMNNKIDDLMTFINNLDLDTNKKENNFILFIKSLKRILIKIKDWFVKVYNKIYKFIFKKRIQRKLEEQRQKEIELEKKKKLEKEKLIKNILNVKK